MSRLIYSPESLQDIARLQEFLRGRDPMAARRAVTSIRESLQKLAVRPRIGRPARGMPPEYREWYIRFGGSGYVALYRYDGNETIILAVRHVREAGY